MSTLQKILLVVALLAVASLVRPAEAKTVCKIGKADRTAADFRYGPSDYAHYADDAMFVVGHSEAQQDWPYVLPGPADPWAGSRGHQDAICFGLKDTPTGNCRLVVDLVDTHAQRPPVLAIGVNGHITSHPMPRGGGDAPILGKPEQGRPYRLIIDIPSRELHAGLNTIIISNHQGSWVVFDAIRFEGPASLASIPAHGTLINNVQRADWSWRINGREVQTATVTLVHIGPEQDATLPVADAKPVSVRLRNGAQTVTMDLPVTRPAHPVELQLKAGDRRLASTTIVEKPVAERQPVDWVDCLIGTHNERWMTFPGAATPFGMVKLSPLTRVGPSGAWLWKAGYEYTIPSIAGFNNIYEWTMAGLATMPTVGALRTQPGDAKKPGSGYRSGFRHETEVAKPGYYAVTLDDYKIRAELTATTRSGFERYTFPQTDDARVLVDLWIGDEYGYRLTQAKVRKVSDTEIEGTAAHTGGASDARHHKYGAFQVFDLHFVMRFSKPMTSLGGWLNGKVQDNITEWTGKDDMGVFVNFRTRAGEQVMVQTGISLVSVEQARLNLETETKPFGWDFDACRAQARRTWNDLLGKIRIEGDRPRDHVKFYTNLYRSYSARTIWSDVNGKYVDPKGKVQQLADPRSPMFGSDAFWNTFWNLNQLWVLVTPDLAEQWVRCQLEFHDKGGWLTKGAPGLKYSGIMTAEHEIALIVAAYQAGLRGFDAEKAWAAIKHILTVQGDEFAGNPDLDNYLRYHYIPADSKLSGGNHHKNFVSNTLEYSYDDWCAAQLAKALGKQDEYKTFLERSHYWKNMFDSKAGVTRPKNSNGKWVEPFNPFAGGFRAGFVEGNAWQYTWFVPQDVRGLIAAMGRDRFIQRLNEGFVASQKRSFSGGQYVNHGNQPTMHAAYLFNHAGVPWLTQKYARAIMNQYYGDTPMHGWLGDEDQGQMGAWFVMSAMGLFQVDGGCRTKPIYEMGSPLFNRIVINLDSRYYRGKKFVIEAKNNSPKNVYIQTATLNGKPWNKPWLYAEQVQQGGRLILTMGPEPNKNWGAGMENAPPPADG